MKHKAFAFVRPDGSYTVDSRWGTEKSVWDSLFSMVYATPEKPKGYRVVQVEVEIPE